MTTDTASGNGTTGRAGVSDLPAPVPDHLHEPGLAGDGPPEPHRGEPALALIEQRLVALRGEYETAQARLLELERQQAFLQERLFMLRGALQALDDVKVALRPRVGPEPEE